MEMADWGARLHIPLGVLLKGFKSTLLNPPLPTSLLSRKGPSEQQTPFSAPALGTCLWWCAGLHAAFLALGSGILTPNILHLCLCSSFLALLPVSTLASLITASSPGPVTSLMLTSASNPAGVGWCWQGSQGHSWQMTLEPQMTTPSASGLQHCLQNHSRNNCPALLEFLITHFCLQSFLRPSKCSLNVTLKDNSVIICKASFCHRLGS